jgi:hypothetical protein
MKKMAPSGARCFKSFKSGTSPPLCKGVGKLPQVLSFSLAFYLLTYLSCSHAEMNQDNLIPKLTFATVSPAYGYIESALVNCNNEGGLGPRYNREEDPWCGYLYVIIYTKNSYMYLSQN